MARGQVGSTEDGPPARRSVRGLLLALMFVAGVMNLKETLEMTIYVLVPGAYGGAWLWRRVAQLLAAAGHEG